MNLSKSFLLVAAGAVGGVLFVLSCGDDGPADVDAAAPVCDCPAAESPITEGRLEIRDNQVAIPAGGYATESNGCDAPAITFQAGCRLAEANPQVALSEAGPYPDVPGSWSCAWNNAGATPATGIVRVVCLNPAP